MTGGDDLTPTSQSNEMQMLRHGTFSNAYPNSITKAPSADKSPVNAVARRSMSSLLDRHSRGATISELRQFVERGASEESDDLLAVKDQLTTIAANQQTSQSVLATLISRIKDVEKHWEVEIMRAVEAEKRKLQHQVQDLSYEAKAKDTEYSYLQGSAIDLGTLHYDAI